MTIGEIILVQVFYKANLKSHMLLFQKYLIQYYSNTSHPLYILADSLLGNNRNCHSPRLLPFLSYSLKSIYCLISSLLHFLIESYLKFIFPNYWFIQKIMMNHWSKYDFTFLITLIFWDKIWHHYNNTLIWILYGILNNSFVHIATRDFQGCKIWWLKCMQHLLKIQKTRNLSNFCL